MARASFKGGVYTPATPDKPSSESTKKKSSGLSNRYNPDQSLEENIKRQREENERQRQERLKEKQKIESTRTGTIKGKVYTNLTEQEILNNELDKNTRALLSPNATAERQKNVERNVAYNEAKRKSQEGEKLNSSDLLLLSSGGRKTTNVNTQEFKQNLKNVEKYNAEVDQYKKENKAISEPKKDPNKYGANFIAPAENTPFFEKPEAFFERNIRNQQAEAKTNPSFSNTAKGTALVIGDIGYTMAKNFVIYNPLYAAYQFVRHPIATSKGIGNLITNKDGARTIFLGNLQSSIEYNFENRPGKFLGNQATILTGDKVISKTTTKIKNQFVKVGSKYIAPENVFDDVVLRGEQTLPTATSLKQSVKAFDDTLTPNKVTKIVDGEEVILSPTEYANQPFSVPSSKYVSTSSPAKIKGTTAGAGRKGGVLEDAGIYVTPKGRGSPYFLRVGDSFDYASSGVSLNPLERLKQLYQTPTVTNFQVEDVVRYPRGVINKPGFKAAEEFATSNLDNPVAYITKRSEIGQGAVKAQTFELLENAKVEMGGKTIKYKAGDKIREAGTSEIEAIVPKGAKFGYTPETKLGKIKGYDYYTEFEGTLVPVREARVISQGVQPSVVPGEKVISPSRIARESSSYSELGTSKVNPYSHFIVRPSSRSRPINEPSSASSALSKPIAPKINIIQSSKASQSTSRFSSSISAVSSSPISSSRVSSIVSSKGSSGGSSRVSTSGSSSASSLSSGVSTTSSSSSKSFSSIKSPLSSLRSSSSTSTSIVRTPPYYSPLPPLPRGAENLGTSKKGFDVITRKFGKEVKINTDPLDLESAKNFGRFRVGTSARASFKLVEVSEPGKVRAFGGSGNARDFKFNAKTGFFVEKRERRIKSAGELREITYKGLATPKKKKKKSRSIFGKVFK